MTEHGLWTLANLTSTNTKTRKILTQDGACNAVLSYLRHHKSNEVIVQAGLAAMKN